MKSILILATPRTGSNLLLDSLAAHPQAVTGGEWLSIDRLEFNTKQAIENIKSGADCNLFKCFFADRKNPEFWNLFHRCDCRIHLYRRDTDAQLLSWKRACETGIWVKDQRNPLKMDPPYDMLHRIEESRTFLTPLCHMAICYETMIEHWEATIEYVLAVADWQQVTLPMAREKQTYADS